MLCQFFLGFKGRAPSVTQPADQPRIGHKAIKNHPADPQLDIKGDFPADLYVELLVYLVFTGPS